MQPDNSTINETGLGEIIDRTIRKANIILDATILTSIMTCPRYSDFRYNMNLVSIAGKSNSLECGSIAHKILETFYKQRIGGYNRETALNNAFAAGQQYIAGCQYCTDFKPFVAPDGTEITKPPCGHQINEYPGVKNTPMESTTQPSRTGWKWVLETMEQYFAFYRNDSWVPLECESTKRRVLYEDDEIRIMWKAKFDLIMDTNAGIHPVDTKTMKQRRDTLSLNNQFMGQCILTDTRRIFINKVGWQTSLKPEEKFTRPPIYYSAPRLMEWQSEILPYYSKLLLMYAETGYWPPNFKSCEGKYGNCAFLEVCEAEPNLREDELRRNFIVGQPWDIGNEEE